MPRRSILSATEKHILFALPDVKDELIRYYTCHFQKATAPIGAMSR
ncbi:hypothetical protein KKJ12_15555 [Xenorhabdus bovienii]|nr:hypothetical protein [Xenorhabdus bovienii]MDE9474299.1 hypothetical protein [Xenorhabdus bovienii]